VKGGKESPLKEGSYLTTSRGSPERSVLSSTGRSQRQKKRKKLCDRAPKIKRRRNGIIMVSSIQRLLSFIRRGWRAKKEKASGRDFGATRGKDYREWRNCRYSTQCQSNSFRHVQVLEKGGLKE